MADRHDGEFDEFLAIRKPGAHLEEEVVPDDFVIQLRVDLNNYHKFPRVDDNVTYPKGNLDIRQELDSDSGAELLDYSCPKSMTVTTNDAVSGRSILSLRRRAGRAARRNRNRRACA